MPKFHQTEWDLLPELAFRPRGGRSGALTLEGGKGGGSAPAPDPRLVEAQIRSMGIQDSAIQSILKNAEALLPMQQEQLKFGIDSAKTAYDQAQSDRQWLLSRRGALTGVQDKLISDAAAFNEGERGEELAGEALADVSRGFSAARGQSARALARQGITPGSGRAMAMDKQLQGAQALAGAGGANAARTAARQEGYALTDRANNALAGYPAMSSQATGSGAAYAASGIGLANAGLAGQNSGYGSAAQVAGQLGTNATGMFGAQATREANGRDQGESFGSILGGVGGAAAGIAKLWASDRRLKTEVELVGQHAVTGLNLYRFAYLVEPARRFIGVMADEVRSLLPSAVVRGADGFDSVDYGQLGLEMVEV